MGNAVRPSFISIDVSTVVRPDPVGGTSDKCLIEKISTIGRAWFVSVVALNFRNCLPRNPIFFLNHLILHTPVAIPWAKRSPYSLSEL